MHDSATRCLFLVPVLAVLAMGAGGCSNSSSTTPTLPSTTASLVTENFSGSINQGGTAIHSFTVNTAGYTLLAGFTSLSPNSVTSLGLGVGSWDASTSTCGLNQTQNDSAHTGSTAVSATVAAGNYCVRVYDAGNLASGVTASYTLQVQHY